MGNPTDEADESEEAGRRMLGRIQKFGEKRRSSGKPKARVNGPMRSQKKQDEECRGEHRMLGNPTEESE